MTRQIYNALLVRYAGGHHYLDRSDRHQRRELYLDLTDLRDLDEVEAFALRFLRDHADARSSDAMEGTVLTGAQVPTVAYRIHDLLAGKRLHGYTATLTPEGLASVVPEVDDPFDVEDALFARQVKRATTGLFSEYATPTIKRQDTGKSTDSEPPEFTQDGAVAISFSPIWTAPRPWWGAWLRLKLVVPGTTRTVVNAVRVVDGVLTDIVATAVLDPGVKVALARMNAGWKVGEDLIVTVTEAGTGASKLTASLRGVMV